MEPLQHLNLLFVSFAQQSKNDFVRIVNEHFLATGGQGFFPVGHNLPFPRDPDIWEWTNPHKCFSPESYLVAKNAVESTANSGQNFLRVLMTPWAFDIEFEKLGNYYERMTNAWELDKFIDKAKLEDIRILLNLQIHYSLNDGNFHAINQWDWPDYNSPHYLCNSDPSDIGYCYSKLGLNSNREFFTDNNAISYYKNKLRYIIARWGYSPTIAEFELFSEINMANYSADIVPKDINNIYLGCKADKNTEINPYSLPNIFPGYIKSIERWQSIMADYIKNTLLDRNHLVGVSYAGPPFIDKINPLESDDIYWDHNIDVISFNRYGLDPTRINMSKDVDKFINTTNQSSVHGYMLHKPMIYSEFGAVDDVMVDDCGKNIYYIKDEWFSAFSGLYGAGLRWAMQNNEDNVWSYLGDLQSYINNIDLSDPDWKTDWDSRSDGLAEMSCLKNKNLHKAIGVISNKSLNYYTMRTTNSCNCYDVENGQNSALIDLLKSPHTVFYNIGGIGDKIKISDMGILKHYEILWYDVFNKSTYALATKWTDAFGELELEYPPLYQKSLNQNEVPLIAFKAYLVSNGSFSIKNPDDNKMTYLNLENQLLIQDKIDEVTDWSNVIMNTNIIIPTEKPNSIQLKPNPTIDFCQILISKESGKEKNLSLISMNGKIIYQTKFTDNEIKIDVSKYNSGIYLVVIEIDNIKYYAKLIKQ